MIQQIKIALSIAFAELAEASAASIQIIHGRPAFTAHTPLPDRAAREQHAGRAAEKSFITQSTLSTSLRDLESTLDVTLVERDRRHVAFTAVGDAVVALRDLVAQANDLVELCATRAQPADRRLPPWRHPHHRAVALPSCWRRCVCSTRSSSSFCVKI
ncbi:LysR family transcriptional regulator [Casimicrobium huifangae]|uniref:LysR family transcriptional regulator n=1 Tax=Casimicrobium huifangae TaxID=2591109 RepID=UPI003783F753